METAPIQYIGKREPFADELYSTGAVWDHTGDIRDVPAEAAPALLTHTDIYQDARPKRIAKAAPIVPVPAIPKRFTETEEEPEPPVKVHMMSAKDLADYARRAFGEIVDASQPLQKVRAAVQHLMRMRG